MKKIILAVLCTAPLIFPSSAFSQDYLAQIDLSYKTNRPTEAGPPQIKIFIEKQKISKVQMSRGFEVVIRETNFIPNDNELIIEINTIDMKDNQIVQIEKYIYKDNIYKRIEGKDMIIVNDFVKNNLDKLLRFYLLIIKTYPQIIEINNLTNTFM